MSKLELDTQFPPIFKDEPLPDTEKGPELLMTSDVLEVVVATYRQLYFWVGNGWLRPQNVGSGSGIPWGWPSDEVEVARRMAAFVSVGVTPEAAHYAARNDGLLPGSAFRITESVQVAA